MTILRATDSTWKTDTGRQRRENEDSAYVRAPVFVVADGMGGAQAGEVASRIATETFQHGLPDGDRSAEQRLADLVRDANHQIYDRSRSEQGREGMGTTLTAAYLDGSQLAVAHVGDSRAYLLRDGDLTRLTQDHSLVDELVRQGKLTEEQAAEHPQRSIITRALGPEPDVEVDTWTYPVRPGDVVLLCSDGLTSMVPEERIKGILQRAMEEAQSAPSPGEAQNAPSLDEAGARLIDEANEAGGRDNITVVLFRLEEVAGATGADQPTIVAPGPTAAPPTSRTAAPGVAVAPRPAKVVPRPPEQDPGPAPRRARRFAKPLAALAAVLVVLFLVGGGGYLATRQLYFIGTNAQGVVTVYRGLPYTLPAGIHLYETYVVSGVPGSLVPADRRGQFFNNQLRSQSDALGLVRQLELGRISQ